MDSIPAKPTDVELLADNIPAELKLQPQWVTWRWTWNADRQKWDKPPLQVDGRSASSTDASTWSTFDDALAAYRGGGFSGIGFVITADCGYVGVDWDDVVHEATGELLPPFDLWVELFDTYAEYSPSAAGVKLWVKADKPLCGNRRGQVEVYDGGRYFTVTGQLVPGAPGTIERRQDVLENFCREYLTDATVDAAVPLTPADAGLPPASYRTAAEVIERIRATPELSRLFDGDISGFDSQSEADLALCQHIVYYAGGPYAELVDEVFRQSGLLRDKWDSRRKATGETYGQLTITKALATETQYERPLTEVFDVVPPPADIFTTMGLEPIRPCDLVDVQVEYRPVLIDNLLRVGETMNVVASSKSYKSWLAMDMALAVANGRPFLGRFSTWQSHVLLLDNELHKQTLQCRMHTVSMHRGELSTATLNAFALRGFPVYVGSDVFERFIADFKSRYGDDGRLVIVDALYRFNPFDENSNPEMTRLYNIVDSCCRKFDVAIVLVHHTSKGNQADKSVTDVGSGAGAISRCPDTHLTIRPHVEDDLAVVDVRARSFPPLATQSWRWTFPVWETSNVEPVLRTDMSGRRRVEDEKASDDVLDALAGATGAMNLSQLAQTTGADRDRVRRVLEGLKAEGQVDEVDRPGAARWFVLSGQDDNLDVVTESVAETDEGEHVEADVSLATTDDVELVLDLARRNGGTVTVRVVRQTSRQLRDDADAIHAAMAQAVANGQADWLPGKAKGITLK